MTKTDSQMTPKDVESCKKLRLREPTVINEIKSNDGLPIAHCFKQSLTCAVIGIWYCQPKMKHDVGQKIYMSECNIVNSVETHWNIPKTSINGSIAYSEVCYPGLQLIRDPAAVTEEGSLFIQLIKNFHFDSLKSQFLISKIGIHFFEFDAPCVQHNKLELYPLSINPSEPGPRPTTRPTARTARRLSDRDGIVVDVGNDDAVALGRAGEGGTKDGRMIGGGIE
ncbi:hypothetical protein C8J56DRAFT_907771 [Mycena floridula]|nr:hypothetical protein C8J56DRAFT_907771 [Mycena floridula]